jgi:hypothetical protein
MSEIKATEVVTTETTQTVEPTVSTTDSGEDEYKWLTERLDAHTTEQSRTRELMEAQYQALMEANRNALAESQTLIHSLSEMVRTQSETLSAMAAASVLSKSTPQTLASTSQETATLLEPIAEVIPDNVANAAQISEPPAQRKRRIL